MESNQTQILVDFQKALESMGITIEQLNLSSEEQQLMIEIVQEQQNDFNDEANWVVEDKLQNIKQDIIKVFPTQISFISTEVTLIQEKFKEKGIQIKDFDLQKLKIIHNKLIEKQGINTEAQESRQLKIQEQIQKFLQSKNLSIKNIDIEQFQFPIYD